MSHEPWSIATWSLLLPLPIWTPGVWKRNQGPDIVGSYRECTSMTEKSLSFGGLWLENAFCLDQCLFRVKEITSDICTALWHTYIEIPGATPQRLHPFNQAQFHILAPLLEQRSDSDYIQRRHSEQIQSLRMDQRAPEMWNAQLTSMDFNKCRVDWGCNIWNSRNLPWWIMFLNMLHTMRATKGQICQRIVVLEPRGCSQVFISSCNLIAIHWNKWLAID